MLTSLHIIHPIPLSFWIFLAVSFWVLKLGLHIQSLQPFFLSFFWCGAVVFDSGLCFSPFPGKILSPYGIYGIIMHSVLLKWHLSLFLDLRRVYFATFIPCLLTHFKGASLLTYLCLTSLLKYRRKFSVKLNIRSHGRDLCTISRNQEWSSREAIVLQARLDWWSQGRLQVCLSPPIPYMYVSYDYRNGEFLLYILFFQISLLLSFVNSLMMMMMMMLGW